LLFLISWFVIYRTTFGLKLRAVVQDRGVASSFGINADRVYSATFAYGTGLAGLAGAIISPLKSVSPEMGTGYVVDAFMVVVLGGVQSLFGTVISAFSLGEVTGVIAFLQNDTIAKAIVLILIISVIRFRPQGLFVAKVRA
jgi:urea transport system permease protein